MKKVIAILIILCITLCACSKSAETPVSSESGTNTNTPIPTKEAETTPVVSPTPTLEPTPTEVPIRTIETDCPLCGRKNVQCKEFIRQEYDMTLKTYVEKAYYFCDNCYDKIVKNEHDCNIYNDVLTYLKYFVITENDVKQEIIKMEPETVGFICFTIDKDGAHYDEVGEKTANAIKENVLNVDEYVSYDELDFLFYTDRDTGEVKISTTYAPKNIIDSLK